MAPSAFPSSVRSGVATVLVALLVLGLFPVTPARANDNPIVEVATSALYGAATGLLLGGVLTLVVDSQHRDDVVRWGVVTGTFGGFAFGIYQITRGDSGFSERFSTPAGPPTAPACSLGSWNVAEGFHSTRVFGESAESLPDGSAPLSMPRSRQLGRSSRDLGPSPAASARTTAGSVPAMGGFHGN
jgi:hypothetical protein